MFSTLSSTDFADYTWSEDELARLEPLWQLPETPGAGAGALPNDPLARLTPWQIFRAAIWESDEDTNTKIMLLCISRFMDKDLRGSSMSYAQIAKACSFSDSTAIRSAKAARDRWLRIEVGRGRYVQGKGNENLYHGIVPERWVEELRRQRGRGHNTKVNEALAKAADEIVAGMTGVSHRHPEQDGGVSHRHPGAPSGVADRHRGVPQTEPGCPTDTLTSSYSPRKKKVLPPLKVAGPTQAEIDAGFAEWWQLYPRKDDKIAARKLYAAVVSGRHKNPECRATMAQLLDGVKRYRPTPGFIKLPTTWLNKGSWLNGAADAAAADPEALQRQSEYEAELALLQAEAGDACRR